MRRLALLFVVLVGCARPRWEVDRHLTSTTTCEGATRVTTYTTPEGRTYGTLYVWLGCVE